MTFKRLADRFCRFGTVKQTRVKRRPIVNKNNATAILAFASLNPHASSRQMEKNSPYFIEGRLTGQVYANFMQNVLPQLLEDVSLHVRMNMWMQHDGAPPHYALCSRQVMNGIFDEKWIGRGGPVAWSPRSPGLTSPYYFLWGFVKERVMAVALTTPDDMKERIRRACTEITPQMLTEVRLSFHQRINKCLQVEGHHFEHLL